MYSENILLSGTAYYHELEARKGINRIVCAPIAYNAHRRNVASLFLFLKQPLFVRARRVILETKQRLKGSKHIKILRVGRRGNSQWFEKQKSTSRCVSIMGYPCYWAACLRSRSAFDRSFSFTKAVNGDVPAIQHTGPAVIQNSKVIEDQKFIGLWCPA